MHPPARIAALTVLALVCAASVATAQEGTQTAAPPPGRQQAFYVDALTFAQSDEFGAASRLDVYVQVPFDVITFIKRDNVYHAEYTVTVLVNDESGARLKEESWTRAIDRTTFENTINPRLSDVSEKSLVLQPGNVVLDVLVEDKESAKELRISRAVAVRAFDRNLFALSDLMLVSRVETREGKQMLTPQIDPNVAPLAAGFSVFMEMYNPFDLPGVTIAYAVTRRDRVVISSRERRTVQRGRNSFLAHVPVDGFSIGPYTITVSVYRGDDTTAAGLLATSARSFLVEWLSGGVPLQHEDLDNAIDQLRYYASSEDIDEIRADTTLAGRRARFEAFWERHNPVPGSKTNRAMIEYYMRVAYANEHFRHFIEGWKTDRGMVYIIYGPPSYVDRHPLDSDGKPYEVWEYDDVNRRFIFDDDTGFGDYRLRYPIWDERNRLRN